MADSEEFCLLLGSSKALLNLKPLSISSLGANRLKTVFHGLLPCSLVTSGLAACYLGRKCQR